MSRSTETRRLVREAAELMAAKGVDPTPSRVRDAIGAGSPNTIVDELRKWRAAQAAKVSRPPQPGICASIATEAALMAPTPLETPGAADVPVTSREFSVSAQTAKELLERQAAMHQTALGLAESVRGLERIAVRLLKQEELLKAMEARLQAADKAVTALEGMRVFAMRQIDDARSTSRYWEEEARRLREIVTKQDEAHRRTIFGGQALAEARANRFRE